MAGEELIVKILGDASHLSGDDIRSSENNCIRLKETGRAVQIEKILRFLIDNASLYTKKVIQS